MKEGLLWVVFCGMVVTSYAQRGDVWQALKEKYPDEPAVYVERSEMMTIDVQDDSLLIYSDVFEDILYLKEQADMFATRRVHGSHFSQVYDIKAKTLVWGKSRHKELSVSSFAKKFDQSDGIFYDDSYYYAFSFPSVAPRNRTQLEYRTRYKDARFMPGYVFTSYIPQEKSVFTIKANQAVSLSYEVRNDPDKRVKFRKYTKGKDVYYEWEAHDVAAVNVEDAAPAIRYYVPHIVCYVKSYKTGDDTKAVLPDLDGLYAWYATFLKDLNAPPSENLVAVVKGLLEPGDQEADVVKKVFYWVQDNIRYVAFEEGMRGLIPHSGSYVCEKRYGDCKDMASMIVDMLKIAGIQSYYTWIGTRDLPYRYSALPTPLVDNHMIATYIGKDGRYYFLDATSNHTPFGFPSSMIQGKEALISKAANAYEVVSVPVMAKTQNQVTDSVVFSIEGKELVGSGTALFTGYAKVITGYKLARSRKDLTEKQVARLLNKGTNKFYLDDFSIHDLEDRDRATRIEYNFRVGSYFQQIGDEIYINLNLNKDFYNEYINTEKRMVSWENSYKHGKREVCVFNIPAGYTVGCLPENASFEGDVVGMQITYTRTATQIVMEKMFYLDFLLLPPDRFNDWNEAVKKLSDIYKESIILKKQ